MDDTAKKAISRRLANAAGHIKGVERMVDKDVYCIDVIKQIQAVQAALNKVSSMMLDNHLRTCITTAIRGDDSEERERMLQEVTNVFDMTTKLSKDYFMTSKTFTVPNISCGHCTHTIELELSELAGVTNVKAEEASKQVTVSWEDPASWDQIQSLLQEINYPPEGLIQIS